MSGVVVADVWLDAPEVSEGGVVVADVWVGSPPAAGTSGVVVAEAWLTVGLPDAASYWAAGDAWRPVQTWWSDGRQWRRVA